MNVFGAFTFGSLMKTFIPGFVWLVALWVLWRGGAEDGGGDRREARGGHRDRLV